jgi:hypothetical protein
MDYVSQAYSYADCQTPPLCSCGYFKKKLRHKGRTQGAQSLWFTFSWTGQPIQRLVRLAYLPPASSTFLSEQISHQQPASSTFLSEQTSTSHQPLAKRTGCKLSKKKGQPIHDPILGATEQPQIAKM